MIDKDMFDMAIFDPLELSYRLLEILNTELSEYYYTTLFKKYEEYNTFNHKFYRTLSFLKISEDCPFSEKRRILEKYILESKYKELINEKCL